MKSIHYKPLIYKEDIDIERYLFLYGIPISCHQYTTNGMNPNAFHVITKYNERYYVYIVDIANIMTIEYGDTIVYYI